MRILSCLLTAVGLLGSLPVTAQSVRSSCFSLEPTSFQWDALHLKTNTIETPPSELFRTIPRQLLLELGPYVGPTGAMQIAEEAGPITTLAGPAAGEYTANYWHQEADSVSLYWQRAPDYVVGIFGWDPADEIWRGNLEEGTLEAGPGHWSAVARLRPVECRFNRP